MKRKKKNIFKRIGEGIKNFFVNIYDNFMKLKPVWRKVVILWIVVLLVIILLIAICGGNKITNNNHSKMEKTLVNSAIDYAKTNGLYGSVDQKLKVSLEELVDQGFMYKEDITDSSCTGYALLYYDEDYHGDAYLLCKRYTTEGYSVK